MLLVSLFAILGSAWAGGPPVAPRASFPGHPDAVFVDASQASLKKQPRPEAPDVVPLRDVTCAVVAFLAHDGVPERVELEAHDSVGCTAPFEEATRDAVLAARWFPLRGMDDARLGAVRQRVTYVTPQFPLRRPSVRPGDDRATCRVAFVVDRRGKPEEAEVLEPCVAPEVVLERARRWRWRRGALDDAPQRTAEDVPYD